jgi:protein deglycase
MSKRILCLLVEGFEEIEVVTPVDLLRRAGIEVSLVAMGPEMIVCGRNRLQLVADFNWQEIVGQDFDGLLLAGGPAVAEMRRDGRAAKLAREFAAAGKTIAAICAAPLILKDADLLVGRNFTSHASVHHELSSTTAERVVVDGEIITARGAGTAVDFALQIIHHMLGEKAAVAIAAEVMAW